MSAESSTVFFVQSAHHCQTHLPALLHWLLNCSTILMVHLLCWCWWKYHLLPSKLHPPPWSLFCQFLILSQINLPQYILLNKIQVQSIMQHPFCSNINHSCNRMPSLLWTTLKVSSLEIISLLVINILHPYPLQRVQNGPFPNLNANKCKSYNCIGACNSLTTAVAL